MSEQEYFCPAYKVVVHVGGAKSDGDDLMISYCRSARSKAKICQYSMLFLPARKLLFATMPKLFSSLATSLAYYGCLVRLR